MRKSICSILKALGLMPLLFLACGNPKEIDKHVTVQNPAFEKKLNQLLTFDVPLISATELKDSSDKYAIIDARSMEEYQVAHIANAQFLDYGSFDVGQWSALPKDQAVAVYCSVGYRSEKIARKFKAAGYQKVYNLYGGIFEWANDGYPLVNDQGEEVQTVHTYNRKWSKWMNNSALKPVY